MTLTYKIDTVVARGPDVMYAKFYGITVLLTCIAVHNTIIQYSTAE